MYYSLFLFNVKIKMIKHIFTNVRLRQIALQIIFVLFHIFLFGILIFNTTNNLKIRGIESGFGFLSNSAGFGILFSLIDYIESDSIGKVYIIGLLNTILVSVIGIVLATLIGFFIALCRISNNWLVSKIATVYVELFRNIPILLQILFWYALFTSILPSHVKDSYVFFEHVIIYSKGIFLPKPIFYHFYINFLIFIFSVLAVIYFRKWEKIRQEKTGKTLPVLLISILILVLPSLIAIFSFASYDLEFPKLGRFSYSGGLQIIPELLILAFSLAVYTATYISEAIRAGILSINKGQREAAAALGLRENLILKLVIVPQSLRVAIPPITNQYLNLTKNSSLATAIGYPELVNVFAGTSLNISGQAIEIMFMTMFTYLTLSIIISVFMNWYNKKVQF